MWTGGRLYALAGCVAIGLAAGALLTALTGYLAFDLSSGPAGAAASGRETLSAVAGIVAAAISAGVLCGAVLGTFEQSSSRQYKVSKRDARYGQRRGGMSVKRAMSAAAGSTSAGTVLVLALALGGGWLYPGMLAAIIALFYLLCLGFLVCLGTYVGLLYVSR